MSLILQINTAPNMCGPAVVLMVYRALIESESLSDELSPSDIVRSWARACWPTRDFLIQDSSTNTHSIATTQHSMTPNEQSEEIQGVFWLIVAMVASDITTTRPVLDAAGVLSAASGLFRGFTSRGLICLLRALNMEAREVKVPPGTQGLEELVTFRRHGHKVLVLMGVAPNGSPNPGGQGHWIYFQGLTEDGYVVYKDPAEPTVRHHSQREFKWAMTNATFVVVSGVRGSDGTFN